MSMCVTIRYSNDEGFGEYSVTADRVSITDTIEDFIAEGGDPNSIEEILFEED